MSVRRHRFLVAAVVLAVALGACGRTDEADSATASRQMPQGYEEVDAAFGVRTGGLVHEGGRYTSPVVEFRTGGDYALYPLTTACDGSFSRGAGTVFSRDGTVREEIGAQDSRPLSASPQFEALIERICSEAKSSRVVVDPFRPQDALALLYGPVDENGEANWMPDADDGLESDTQRVSLRRNGAFAVGEERWSYVLTGSRDPGCEAHVCGGGAVGGALFRFADGKWALASHVPMILRAGTYGEAVDGNAFRILQVDGRPPLVQVDSGDCHMGHCAASATLVAVVDGRFATVLSEGIVEHDRGSMRCEDSGRCTDWSASIRLLDGGDAAFPDVELVRKGTSWDEDRSALFEIDETVVYRYDSVGRYHEHARSGGMVELLPPEPEYDAVSDGGAGDHATQDVSSATPNDSGPPLSDAEAQFDATSRSMNPPRYPPAALRAGITGIVGLIVEVDASGNAVDVQVERSSGNRDLDRAAVDAAKRWKVNPAIENGRPVASRMRVPVEFSL